MHLDSGADDFGKAIEVYTGPASLDLTSRSDLTARKLKVIS